MGDVAALMRPVRMGAEGYSLADYYGWIQQAMGPLTQTYELNQERIEANFEGLVTGTYQRNGVVFACLQTRAQLFSQVRFQFQQLRGGQPGDLFGTPELNLIENPEPGMQTGDLLNRAIAQADLGGDWFGVRRPGRIKTLRPDWTIVLIGSPNLDFDTPADDPDAEVVGYQFWPGGIHNPTSAPWNFLREEVAHFFPVPDPIAKYRGMPLVTSILRDIAADSAASAHKLAFFEHAAPQPLDARILTPAGWTTMGSIEVGDRVIGRDGQPHEVLGVYPKGEQDIYRVTFSDGAATESTADHLWEVASAYDRQRGVTRSLTLAQIMADGASYPSGPRRWSVPLPEPIAFDDPGPLPMDPYLLGVMLGDGSFRNGAVTFSTADPEIVESVRELVPAGVEVAHLKEYEYHLRAGARGVKHHPMIALAKSLGLWNVIGYEKAVPEPYLRASIFDREALLQGLIDTDGHVAGSVVRFTNTSETLARQVAELARSLGARASVKPVSDRPGQPNRRPQWTVTINRLPEWIVPCRLTRKVDAYHVPSSRSPRHRYIASIEPVGRKLAQCIYVDVPDHLYVTDDYIVTHNTPNMVVRFPAGLAKEKATEWITLFEQEHAGVSNAYRTMYLGAGAEADVVGRDMQQLDFKATQGAGQSIIAAALNVHPTVVGLSEGLQGSSLNSGNFGAARRLVADKMLRPAWGNFAASLSSIVPALPGTRLWYDDRHVPFLAEDVKDAAEVLGMQATAMVKLGDSGWERDAVVDAVVSGDLRRLMGHHTGLTSVQLQPPVTQVAALATFWPSTPLLPGEVIERGAVYDNSHPIVRAYPSLFGRAEGVAA